MNPAITLLITLTNGQCIQQVVVKLNDLNKVPDGVLDFYLEPESKKFYWSLLPDHLRWGNIVDVKQIWDSIEVHL